MTRQRGRKIAEVVAREILKDALRRKLPPGSRLAPESEMTETFDVGRGSLREALRILEVQGLISIRPGPGGGPFLRAASSRDFGAMSTMHFMATGSTYGEMIEARLALTPLLARLAAERREPGAGERMAAAIEATRVAMDVDDRAWVVAASEFYPVVGDLAGNRILALYADSLRQIYIDHLPRVERLAHHREGVLASHERIAAAVVAGDGAAAEREMRERMEEFVEHLTEAFPTLLFRAVDWQ